MRVVCFCLVVYVVESFLESPINRVANVSTHFPIHPEIVLMFIVVDVLNYDYMVGSFSQVSLS